MKATKLNTDVLIKYNKKGNIKTIKTPYDKDKVINRPINDPLTSLFETFANIYKPNN